jgi:hypothetical protein
MFKLPGTKQSQMFKFESCSSRQAEVRRVAHAAESAHARLQLRAYGVVRVPVVCGLILIGSFALCSRVVFVWRSYRSQQLNRIDSTRLDRQPATAAEPQPLHVHRPSPPSINPPRLQE